MYQLKSPWNALTRVGVAVVVLGVGFLAYRAYGWPGLALAAGALVMWVLLHMSRMLLMLRRTANRPVGLVENAVMFHAGLHRAMTLLQVLAIARSLGQRVSVEDEQPEIYQWRDIDGAVVRCTFEQGKLRAWELLR
jgi:hypothetical protein